MVGHEQRIDLVDQNAQSGEIGPVEPMGGTDRHGNAVEGDGKPLSHLTEDMARSSTIDHEVLGNDFDEIDRDICFDKIGIMRFAQAEPET